MRTVIDCCLDLPFADALSVADSARRAGLRPSTVLARSAWLPARQRDQVARVLAASDARATGPFESSLRAIALGVPGLVVEPQTRIRYDGFFARVDLADEGLRIVLEADSHEFHTERKAFDRDCRRYNGLVTRDWLVLRFTWEQVMFEPDVVRCAIEDLVALRRSQGLRRLRTGRLTGSKPAKGLLRRVSGVRSGRSARQGGRGDGRIRASGGSEGLAGLVDAPDLAQRVRDLAAGGAQPRAPPSSGRAGCRCRGPRPGARPARP